MTSVSDHRAAAEAEVSATVTAIAVLRRRISRPGTLEHPAVIRELGKLEEQLTVQLYSQTGRRPGRHRAPVHRAFPAITLTPEGQRS